MNKPQTIKKTTMLFALITLLALVLGSVWVARAASDWYVRTDGSDTNCNGTADLADPGGTGPFNCAFKTIQKGIDAAAAGDTVHVAAGTYMEVVTINKQIVLVGAGSDASGTVITNPSGVDYKIGVIQISASGTSSNPILLKDLLLNPVDLAGISVGRFTEATGISVSYLELNNVYVIGTNTNGCTEQERGFYVDLTSSVDHLTVTNSAFNNLTYGWYIQKQVSADTSTVQYVTVTNTTFNHNIAKGIYAEKLSDAIFTGITVDQNGYDGSLLSGCTYFQPWMSGVDLNLKAGVYQNLTFDQSTITNNGLGGAKEGVGITIKGRGTGSDSSYSTFPATVTTVTLTNNTISGNERGVRFGEPGKSNTGPTNVVVYRNTLANNVKTYSGSDGSAYGDLVNQSTVLTDAEENYWGTMVPAEVMTKTYGSVDYQPWCNSDFSSCTYTLPVHNITQGTDHLTIQAGIDAAVAGDEIHIDAGTYLENVLVTKAVKLVGAGMGSTIVQPAVSNPNPCTGSSLCGSITASSNIFGIQANDVTIQDLTIDGDNPGLTSGIVVGGADLDARNGIIEDYYSGVYNNLVIHHVEIKNIYLRGIYASSGGSGFNFHHNTVTNVQADSSSIGIFNFGGSGTIADNTISYANDAIAANHSRGTQFLNNVVTHSGSGVHTDNAGDGGGVADLIQGNTVSDCSTDGYGVWTFVPYLAPTVTENTITNCAVGISAWGQGAVVTPVFSKNVVDGPSKAAGSVGVYITTDWISWGYSDISVIFENNVITDNEYGVQFIAGPQSWNPEPFTAQTITAFFSDNDLSGNTYAADKDSDGYYNLNASGNWWGTNVPADVKTAVNNGDGIDYTPWLASGTDTSTDPGFQGDFSNLWVDDDSPQTGSTGRIQEGIDLVTGSTVNVAVGLYDERLVIDKPLVLKGATQGVNKKGYAIPSGYAYNPAVESIIRPSIPQEAAVVLIKSDDVVIDGFVVAYEVAQTGGVYQDLINLDQNTSVTSGIQIINNVIGPNTNTLSQDGTMGRSGFTVLGPRLQPVKNLVITDNKIFDAKGNGCGIMIVASYSPEYHGSGTGYTDMSGGLIANNEITGNHRSGIELAGGVSGETPDGFVIKDNWITHNGWSGTGDAANLKYGNGVTLIRGGSDKAKANPSGSRFLLFETNVISDNEKNGIYFGSQNTDIRLDANVISNNGVGGGGYNTWDGVRIDLDEAYYTGHTIRYDILKNIKLNFGTIAGNGDLGVKVIQTPAQGPIDAEYNYWGAACGPAGVGPGTGDGVSGNVDYNPWWVTSGGPATAFEGTGGELVIPTGATQATAQAVIDCATGKTVMFESGAYTGGLNVGSEGITLKLNSCTVGPGSPAFTITADDVTLLGPGTLDGSSSTSPAVLVQGGADNFMLKDAQVKGWADGVEVAGSVTSFKLINNWIHSNSDAGLQINSGVSLGGVVTIEGNLFKVNGGNGVQNNSAGLVDAEYNSWGDVDGPTGSLGDGISANVDADPWTFAETYLDMDPVTTGDQYQRNVIETVAVDVSLNLEAANLYGVSFRFTYDTTKLTLNSTTFSTPWTGKCILPVTPPPAGTIAYICNLTGGADWDGGKVVTFNFTPTGSGLSGDGPWQALFDLSHLEANTSSGAIGGIKVFVNNAGFNDPSTTDRDITDANDGQLDITGIARFKGYIDLEGRGNDSGAEIKVYNASNGTVIFAQGSSASSGAYLTNYQGSNLLQVGSNYWFFVDRALYLPTAVISGLYNPNHILTDRPETSLATLLLLGGDATNDDLIDVGDAGCIGGAYGGSPTACGIGGSSDANGDGTVNLYDLVLMGGNYSLTYSPWMP